MPLLFAEGSTTGQRLKRTVGPPGIAEAEHGHATDVYTEYRGVPELGIHIINEAVVPVPADAPAAPLEDLELGKPAQIWRYPDAAGDTLGYVYRFDPPGPRKEYRPLTLHRTNDKLDWRWETWPTPRPLYGLDKLAERPSAKVIVAEGEKSADAAQKLLPDHVTVTSPNGQQRRRQGRLVETPRP
jgi:hypothetical protein